MLPQVNKVDILVCGVEVTCAEGWLGHGREYPIYSGQGIAQNENTTRVYRPKGYDILFRKGQ